MEQGPSLGNAAAEVLPEFRYRPMEVRDARPMRAHTLETRLRLEDKEMSE
jgi:hypothetical protein